MQFFLDITLGGIATGMIVSAVALGLVLIFRATNVSQLFARARWR